MAGGRASWRATAKPKSHQASEVEPDGARGKNRHLLGEISGVRAPEKSAEAIVVRIAGETRKERRAEGGSTA